jgi:hippurate hydrolase
MWGSTIKSPNMNAPLPLPALDAIRAHEAEMVAIRQQIHANPELAYEEHATSDLVAERWQRWGWEVHRGLGGTGVVGTLRAGHQHPPHRPARRHGRPAHRRDQRQALGQQGVRQDARLRPRRPHRHAAVGLRATWPPRATSTASCTLVFQPAEEGLAGARKMLEDGFLELFPCDAMFGMHNMPGLPEGQFQAVPGFAMASGDTCIITVRGTGGHGAIPQAAVDPVVAGASIVMALQTIVARNVPPLHTGIITVGAFLAGDAPNVIPGTAELRLTVRAMQPRCATCWSAASARLPRPRPPATAPPPR